MGEQSEGTLVRHTEFWSRLEAALGESYAGYWAGNQVMAELGGRTPAEALDAGESPKRVWSVVGDALDLPPSER